MPMKVDVAMCTWNSNKSWFSQCLASIKRELSTCHFIVVDRFSDDGTVETIKRFFPDAIIIETDVNLGKARQEAIKYLDTEWFVFVDDDVELCTGWFKSITANVKRETGAIAGVALPTLDWLRKLFSFGPEMAQNLRREWKGWRGIYLSNTLIRTELVKDWSPPSFISSNEDAHLARHISEKGYLTTLLYDLYVNHHGRWGLRSVKKNTWHYAGARLVGYTDLKTKRLIRRFLLSPLKGLYAAIKIREPLAIPYFILSEYYYLKGWLQWNKYVLWRR